MAKSGKKTDEIELHEDAWPRFEQFVRDVARGGPQHRTKREPGKPSPRPRSRQKVDDNRKRP